MMKKTTMSLAVMMLIGESNAKTHTIRHEGPGAYDFIEFVDEEDEEQQTAQSIAESEKLHKAKFTPGEDTYKQSLSTNNKLNFENDEFHQNGRIDNSMQKIFVGLQADNMFIPQSAMQTESDPIHGSLGPPKVPLDDLTAEQRFEEMQRRMPPQKTTPDEDVINVEKSMAAAEEITGNKMPEPEEEKKEESLVARTRQFVGLSADNMFIPQAAMQVESDPIHGSLGPPKVKLDDLLPDQQFEERQRRMPPAKFEDSEDVKTTTNSIKIAEELVGDKMPGPTDAKQVKKYTPTAMYHLHTPEEEDEDTKETRRSVKTVEKGLKTRFWINAKEKRDYDQKVMEGKISDKELEFKEGKDEDIGADQAEVAEQEAAAKEEAAKKAEAKAAESKLTEEEKKAAEAVAAAKDQAEQADESLPPELAAPALAQRRTYSVRI